MKRFLLAAVLIGTLIAGCGGSNKTPTAKTSAVGQATTPPTVTTPTTPTTSKTSTTAIPRSTKHVNKRTTVKPTTTRTRTTRPKPLHPPRPPKKHKPPIYVSQNPHRATVMGAHPVVALSSPKPSAVCPALKKDLAAFGEASEAPLVATSVAEIQEAFHTVDSKSAALKKAVKGLDAAFPKAKSEIAQLEAELTSYRSTLAATGSHGNLTLLAGPTERVMRAGRSIELSARNRARSASPGPKRDAPSTRPVDDQLGAALRGSSLGAFRGAPTHVCA